jgi:ATP-dependent exoDNAse (exonuclease V) alpha subunit
VAELSLSAALSRQYWEEQEIGAQSFTLTQIVRQQQDNEILEVASAFRVRIEQPRSARLLQLPVPKSRNVFATDAQDGFLAHYFKAVHDYSLTQTVAICHSNMQAHYLNTHIRSELYDKYELQAGDLLMVVQNSYNTDLANGDQVIVKEVHFAGMQAGFSFSRVKVESLFEKKEYETLLINDLLYNASSSLSQEEVKRLLVDFDERMRRKRITRNSEMYKARMKEDEFLNALRAKFGYAITVHKAQGGEWNAVLLYLDKSIYSMIYHPRGGRHPDGADRYHRWLYTAVTRAREKLVVNESQFVQQSF